MSSRGIVILGTPRSGTTLVRRILDAHSRIACPPETYLLSAAARYLYADRFAAGLEIGVLSGLSYAGVEEDEIKKRLREMTFSFLDEHASRQGKARWAEKTAFDAFHIPRIDEVFGDHVDFVCIVRHGLDVAVSLKDLTDKTGGFVEELHRYVVEEREPLRAFARAWVDTCTKVVDLAERRGAPVVRYEDLAEDPQGVMTTILKSVGESYEENLVERALSETGQVGFGDWKTFARASIDTSSVDRWKGLPAAQILDLARVCNPLLQRLGYDAVPENEEAVDDARRRYELGLLANRLKQQKDGG